MVMSEKEKQSRIYRNTIFLYIQQILVMGAGFLTARVVLDVLGEEDYGVYNVICGFVMMFDLLSGAFSIVIGRFLTFELGRGNLEQMRRIFSSAMLLQIFIGVLILLMLFSGGQWFVEHKLVIPEGRMNVAVWILRFSGIAFFVELLSVPYNALIIAHERMKIFAFIGVFQAVFRLVNAGLLLVVPWDKLLFYGASALLVSVSVRMIYAVYCKRFFPECRWSGREWWSCWKGIFSFAGWLFLGYSSFVLREQGVNILLNLFCGPVVNAARAVSMQVCSSVSSFTSNFLVASRPQITKNFSSGELQEMRDLVCHTSCYAYYLTLFLALPLIFNVDDLLAIWLRKVPEYTAVFIVLTLIYALVDTLGQPMMTGLLAEGNIRGYEIWLLILNGAGLCVAYGGMKAGAAPVFVYWMAIAVSVLITILRLLLSRKAYGLTLRGYGKEVMGPVLRVTVLATLLAFLSVFRRAESFWHLVLNGGWVAMETAVVIYFAGMGQSERVLLREAILVRVRRLCGRAV